MIMPWASIQLGARAGMMRAQEVLFFANRSLIDWISDPALRRRANAGLNKGEARNALARAVFFHRLVEIRDRTFENQRYRASGLNLVVAAIILWNTVYLSRAVTELRSQGEIISDDLLAHVAPLGWEHITFKGDYVCPQSRSKMTSGHCGGDRSQSLTYSFVRFVC
jgi:hypothetical protein